MNLRVSPPPVIWELTRSFFYAEPSCVDGQYDEAKLKDYVGHYCNMAPLTQYDRDNLMKLYLYQLAVCDYYSQQYYGSGRYKNTSNIPSAVCNSISP